MEFQWPVGSAEERVQFGKLPGRWNAATKFAQRYDATGKWAVHTGLDLNLNYDATGMYRFDLDAHAPVYAAENGVVKFAGKLPVWGSVIVLKHPSERLPALWTRYAHVEQMTVKAGDLIYRGTQMARVGNADGRYPYHLHYDMAVIDLGQKPSDWPGDNLTRVLSDYRDPMAVMRDQLAMADGEVKTRLRVTASPALNVREQPSVNAKRVGRMPYGSVVEPIEIRDGWARIETTSDGAVVAGWIVLAWTKEA